MPKIIENLKENIILESRKLLSNKGYKDLNIREIAKNCDIALGTFYNYFSTKDELVLEIVREEWGKISNLIDSLKKTDEPCKEKFRKIYLSLDYFISSYVSIFIELSLVRNYTQNNVSHQGVFQILYDNLSELIEIEKTKGNINSTLPSHKLAQLIMSNLIYLNMNKYIEFDDLYDSLRIEP